MIVVLSTLASAILFYLSQGIDDVWALAWLAPVPLLWLAYSRAPLWQLIAASVASILAGDIYVLQVYSMLPPVLILPVVGLHAVLFPAAVVFARAAHRHASPLATLLGFPAAWTACELLISLISPHGSFGSLAYSQVSAPLLIQTASLWGLYAVTFLICLFANICAMALRPQRQAALAIGLGLAVCAASALFGLARLAQPPSDTVRVAALVDADVPEQASRAKTLPAAVAVAERYASEIRQAAAQGARFVVTPEGGIVSAPPWRSAIVAPLLASAQGAQVIAGVLERDPPGDLAWSLKAGSPVQRYAKRHLVPILETPYFVPGHGSGWLGQGRAMEVCKDMDFPATIRRDAAKGVRLMGVPAGDFGGDAWLHARMAIMRGVEDGFALVRAANDGMVTASDAEGRLIASKKVAPAGLTLIVADLPLGPGPTFYARTGDLLPWGCLLGVLAISAHLLLRRKWPSGAGGKPDEAPLPSRLGASDGS